MHQQCYFCHQKTIEKLIHKINPDNKTAIDLIFTVNEYLQANQNLTNPHLTTQIQRFAKEKLRTTDLYTKEKTEANELLIADYAYWKHKVITSENPFQTAAKLAVVGNIIDYGAHCVADDIRQQIESFFKLNLTLNATAELAEALSKAKSVLYLGDNAGEIVFDKLFIETMKHPNVTFVVRGNPVINDVTIDDAKEVGIDKICKVISNGYDAPSTLVELYSDEFQKTYHAADLIIAKGQGNFEGLMHAGHKNMYFLLIAKCDIIANYLGVKKNNMVVTRFLSTTTVTDN